MKRVENGDKMTKWKPRNKQAGLFLRKAKKEFEPLPDLTPRVIKPEAEDLEKSAKEVKNRVSGGKIQDIGTRHKKKKVRPYKNRAASTKPRIVR